MYWPTSIGSVPLKVERATKRGESHQSVDANAAPIMHTNATGDVGLHEFKVAMFPTQHARAEEPFFRLTADADGLDEAMKHALRTNQLSMDNLQVAIANCMRGLRAEGMRCEAALLTMKASVRHMARKHARESESGILYAYPLMDQIVRWSIDEFYRDD